MNKYYGLDTLMASNGIETAESFSAYYIRVLSRRENQNLNVEGFEEWGDPQIGFTYKELEAKQHVSVMATYVDLNSEPIPIGTEGFETLEGSIPRQKARFQLGENDYRKQVLVIENLRVGASFTNQSPEASVKAYLVKLLFGGLSEIQDAHIGSMSYQVGQMKSEAKVTLTDANNPHGIQNITFTAHVPDGNIKTLTLNKRWFTDDAKTTEGSESDPVNDLKKMVRDWKNNHPGEKVCVEVNATSFFEDMQHSKWQIALGYALAPDLVKFAGVGDDGKATAAAIAATSGDPEIQAAFKKVIGADQVLYNETVCYVETYDKSEKKLVKTKLDAFSKNRYSIRPVGAIGKRLNVAPMRPDPTHISTMMFENHGMIEYIYDARTKTQDWISELTVLAVPTRPRDMYLLKTK